jgi:hypothetical protein
MQSIGKTVRYSSKIKHYATRAQLIDDWPENSPEVSPTEMLGDYEKNHLEVKADHHPEFENGAASWLEIDLNKHH